MKVKSDEKGMVKTEEHMGLAPTSASRVRFLFVQQLAEEVGKEALWVSIAHARIRLAGIRTCSGAKETARYEQLTLVGPNTASQYKDLRSHYSASGWMPDGF